MVTRRGNTPYRCWRNLRIPGQYLDIAPGTSLGDTKGSQLALGWGEGGRMQLNYGGLRMWQRVFELALESVREIRRQLSEMRPETLQWIQGRLLILRLMRLIRPNGEECEDNKEEMDYEEVELGDRAEDDEAEIKWGEWDCEIDDEFLTRVSDYSDNSAEEGYPLNYGSSSDDEISVDNLIIDKGAEQIKDQTTQNDSPDDSTDVSELNSDINDVEQDGFEDQTLVEDDSSDDAIRVSEKLLHSRNPTSESQFSQFQS